jgi:hypothetical protein
MDENKPPIQLNYSTASPRTWIAPVFRFIGGMLFGGIAGLFISALSFANPVLAIISLAAVIWIVAMAVRDARQGGRRIAPYVCGVVTGFLVGSAACVVVMLQVRV